MGWLSHDDPVFYRFIGDVPLDTLRQLTELDYHMALLADRMYFEIFGLNHRWVSGVPGIGKALSHTMFECIRDDKFDDLVPAEFLSVRFKYDYMTTSNDLTHTLLGGQ